MVIDPSTQLEILGPVWERTTQVYQATIVDTNNTPITDVSSIYITLTNAETETVINNRRRQLVYQSTTGSVTSGTKTVTVASTTNFAIGQTLIVSGAGTNGADLSSVIAHISGSVVTVSDNASTDVTTVLVYTASTGVSYNSGVFTISFAPVDMPLFDVVKVYEDHVLTTEYTYNTSSKGIDMVLIRVRNPKRLG